MASKRCTKCGAEKPPNEFHKGKGPDGRVAKCKQCRRVERVRRSTTPTVSGRSRRSVEHLQRLEELKATAAPGMKVCSQCLETKPLSAFHNHAGFPDGKGAWCKGCMSAAQKPKRHEFTLKHRHGLSVDEYDRMLQLQAGCCAICRVTNPGTVHGWFVVDHNHATGVVRGLLCGRCNLGLGQFEDSSDRLVAAAQYLRSRQGD